MPRAAKEHLESYQRVRNDVFHGKGATAAKMREAIFQGMEYMNALGTFVKAKTEKNPFGDLRGLKGRKELLPKGSTIWMLKGFGFSEKTADEGDD